MKNSIGYQERNHWIAIGIALWALWFYFSKVAGLEGGLNADILGILPTVIKITVFSSIVAALLAIISWAMNRDKHVEKDEMDRLIELKGFRNAYWTSSISLWVVIIAVLLNEYAIRNNPDWYRLDTVNLVVHGMFLVACVSALVQSTTHVIFYRRGIA